MNLDTASREQLLQLIAEQQATIAQQQATIQALEARVRDLEARLAKGGPRGMPGLKPQSVDPARPPRPRQRRAHNCARRRAPPTARIVHALAHCPTCGTGLAGGSVHRTREVIEVVCPPVRVVEHVYLARQCPQCRRRCVPPPGLAGQVLGRQRLGIGAVSLIATLREEGRLPIATIQWYLRTVHRLRLSQGAIVDVLRQVAHRGRPAVATLREQIRASPVVNADETGWREAGRNGYVWTFSTPTARYFVRRGRHKAVVDEVLGAQFDGVLVSDFYAAYHHYEGVKQRCWTHLLREIHELTALYPDDARVQAWAAEVHAVYAQAKAFSATDPPARERQWARRRFEQGLLGLCQPYLTDPTAPQRSLCARIERHLAELFVFVVEPGVPADNNAAERSLRHLVTSRKISGGTRSAEGTDAKMVLSSLFGTWRAQGLNPFVACRQLLGSPQV
jgi:transposase